MILTPQLPLSNFTPSYLYPKWKKMKRNNNEAVLTEGCRKAAGYRDQFNCSKLSASHLWEWWQCTLKTEAGSSLLQLLVWSMIGHKNKTFQRGDNNSFIMMHYKTWSYQSIGTENKISSAGGPESITKQFIRLFFIKEVIISLLTYSEVKPF